MSFNKSFKNKVYSLINYIYIYIYILLDKNIRPPSKIKEKDIVYNF